MEKTNETTSNWAHFPSPCKNDPSSIYYRSTPSSSSKNSTETNSVLLQDDKVPGIQEGGGEQSAGWEVILEHSSPQFSHDRRNSLIESTPESSGEQAFTHSVFRSHFPSKKGVVFQRLQPYEVAACSSDESSSSDESPRFSPNKLGADSPQEFGPTFKRNGLRSSRSDLPGEEGVLFQKSQPDGDSEDESSSSYNFPRASLSEHDACSSDESSSSEISPRSSPKTFSADDTFVSEEVVGSSISNLQELKPSGSHTDEGDKRPYDPDEGRSSFHVADFWREKWATDSLCGQPTVVPIEVYVLAPKSVEEIAILLGKVILRVEHEFGLLVNRCHLN